MLNLDKDLQYLVLKMVNCVLIMIEEKEKELTHKNIH